MALRLANADVLPFDFDAYARSAARLRAPSSTGIPDVADHLDDAAGRARTRERCAPRRAA